VSETGLALYAQGQQALEAGDASRAHTLLSQACTQLDDHGAAHHLLGKAKALLGQFGPAEALQQRSCELDPSIGWNWFALAELRQRSGRWADAARAYEQALAVLPDQRWIAAKALGCRHRALVGGEDLSQGLGPAAYQYWCDQLEGRWPSELVPLQQAWQVLPAGHSCPLPVQGWLIVLGSGSVLRPQARQALEALLISWELEQPDLISADEDVLDGAGLRHDPWFKPAQLHESSWSTPWLESISVWRCSWLREQQLPPPPAEPARRLGWVLQALARRPRHRHAPLILVHQQRGSTPALEPPAAAALLQAHLQQGGEAITAVTPHPSRPTGFVLQWALPQALRCTAIVPTCDRSDLMAQCLESVSASCERSPVELHWLVVDNGSTEPALASLLAQWQARLGDRLRVLRDAQPFNWSQLNNAAAQHCTSELLLFLNNDIEAQQPGWLETMAAQAQRPAVGCVGAALLYPDGTLQHAGVVVGMHFGADHAYKGLPRDHGVHRGRSSYLSDWGAVTGACLMVRRDLFERLGGFDPALPVEFNDVDFCLRLAQLGYRHVIDPAATLIHHESQSRDASGSLTAGPALALMQRRWMGRLANPSPWWPQACAPHCSDGRPMGLDLIQSL